MSTVTMDWSDENMRAAKALGRALAHEDYEDAMDWIIAALTADERQTLLCVASNGQPDFSPEAVVLCQRRGLLVARSLTHLGWQVACRMNERRLRADADLDKWPGVE